MMQRFSALLLEVSVSCTVVRNYCRGIIMGEFNTWINRSIQGTNVPIGVTDLMLKILKRSTIFFGMTFLSFEVNHPILLI